MIAGSHGQHPQRCQCVSARSVFLGTSDVGAVTASKHGSHGKFEIVGRIGARGGAVDRLADTGDVGVDGVAPMHECVLAVAASLDLTARVSCCSGLSERQ